MRRWSWPQGDQPSLLLFANAASERRERLTVRASFDDGRTWPVSRQLSPQPAAYSCLVALPGGAIGLLYETGPKSPYQSIAFVAFTLDWLKQGAASQPPQ